MTTIKVSGPTRDRLKRPADEEHLTMDAALSRALDQVEDARFWQGVRADYARMQADPPGWAGCAGELAAWAAQDTQRRRQPRYGIETLFSTFESDPHVL